MTCGTKYKMSSVSMVMARRENVGVYGDREEVEQREFMAGSEGT